MPDPWPVWWTAIHFLLWPLWNRGRLIWRYSYDWNTHISKLISTTGTVLVHNLAPHPASAKASVSLQKKCFLALHQNFCSLALSVRGRKFNRHEALPAAGPLHCTFSPLDCSEWSTDHGIQWWTIQSCNPMEYNDESEKFIIQSSALSDQPSVNVHALDLLLHCTWLWLIQGLSTAFACSHAWRLQSFLATTANWPEIIYRLRDYGTPEYLPWEFVHPQNSEGCMSLCGCTIPTLDLICRLNGTWRRHLKIWQP